MKLLMFPGQGTQKPGMGFDIYNSYKSAKNVFNEVDDTLGFKLSEMIFNGNSIELTQTENAQVSIMATSIAYLKAYEEEWGIKLCDSDAICAGHSLGEYSALCAAEVLSLQDTVKLLWARGNAMKECSSFKCGMAAILGLTLEEVEALVAEAKKDLAPELIVQVANDNCNGQVVISGHKVALESVIDKAKASGARRAIFLNVAGAFHSDIMAPAAEKLAEALNNVKFNSPKCPVFANFTAKTEIENFSDLLIKQITGCVRWREILLNAFSMGIRNAFEIGPDSVLSGLAKRTVPDMNVKNINSIDSIKNR